MSYARQTIQLHSVAPDLIPADAPLEVWNSARNIVFRDRESIRVPGDTPTLQGYLTQPRTMVLVEAFDTPYWVYAGDGGVFASDGTLHFDITPAGWIADTGATWTSCVLNGLAIVNVSDRDPVWWNGNPSTPCTILPGWPANGRCYALRAHKNFLFGIGFLSEGDQRVRWSDAAEAGQVPQEWEPSASNLAGFQDLAPLSSPCLDGATLRDDFMVYKAESVHAFTFIGGTFVFSIRKVFSQHGVASTNALTVGPAEEHLFVAATGDVMLTNGVEVRSILDGRAQRTFYKDFTSEQSPVFSCATLMREKLGIIIYPGSSGDQAILFDFTSGDIGFRQMPEVWCAAEGRALSNVGDENEWDSDDEAWVTDAQSWNEQVVSQTNDDVLIGGPFGFAVLLDPAAINFIDGPVSANIEKTGLSFGNAGTRKMVGRVWPKVSGRPGDVLTFRVAAQEDASGPVSLSAPQTYTIGSSDHLDVFQQGRFLGLTVDSTGGGAWRLGSIDVEFREVGGW